MNFYKFFPLRAAFSGFKPLSPTVGTFRTPDTESADYGRKWFAISFAARESGLEQDIHSIYSIYIIIYNNHINWLSFYKADLIKNKDAAYSQETQNHATYGISFYHQNEA